ncbi:MAG: translation initiation factor IF-2 [Bacteroidota bacterium]|nr:translation initiation factor IF-2 [Bacteroidota bacterium]
MSEGTTTLRLSKVAKEFNLSLGKIVEFLGSKGHKVDSNPNGKIGDAEYKLLLKEFSSDKSAREEAENVSQNIIKVKRETIVLDDLKAKKQKEEEVDEVIIKDLTIPKKIVDTEITKDVTNTTVTSEEKTETIKQTVDSIDGPKVIGKLDLDAMNLKTKPGKKTKKAEEEKPTKEKTKKEAVDEVKEVGAVIEEVKEETVVTPAVEEVKEEFIETKYEKLEGPKILGSIVLPVHKEVPKKSVGGENKTKRKRIRKGGLSQEEIKKVGTEQTKIADERKKEKYGTPRTNNPNYKGNNTNGPRTGTGSGNTANKPRHELTEEEIAAQIKETLARLSSKGSKSKTSKYRREKRDDVRGKMAERAEIAEADKKTLTVAEFVSANQLAQMMDVQVTQIISTCMSLGLFVSINQRLDAETISIVAEEFGYKVAFASAEDVETIKDEAEDKPEDLISRAPIVTVMGHVDHGKTSLLDFIRKATVVAGEAGGITQHIGAYNVQLADGSGRSMTFLDTPGHEAFTAMRARGAKVTDIAIIVVAADDSVMPQTKEAINHAQAAGVPMIFAINKIDKPGANPDKIREALSAMNILVEEWGGKYQCQEVSAKKGLGIDLLLEKVLLEADMMDLKANPNKNAQGSVIEASMEEGRGYVATILVQSGTLKIGDVMLAGGYSGRVRAMFNERGQKVTSAGPSHPVKVLGLTGAPTAGDKFNVMSDEREAREIATKRLQLQREQGIRTHKHITLDEIGRRLAIGDFKELNVIVKGDVDGSIEALSDSLLKLSTEKVAVNIIHKSVGAISESDVLLASASNAIIIGFQVRPSTSARKLAEVEEIDIRLYSIIYDAINEIKAAMEGMLAPEYVEKIVCNIEIREVFNITKVGTIAGCYVLDGKVMRNTKIRIIRDGIVVHTGGLGSLKRFKDDVKEVAAGYECGLNIEGYNDIKQGDIIEGYDLVEVKAKL